VVVSADALVPQTASISVNLNEKPTVATVGPDQDSCTLTSTLGGNTPTIGSGVWTLKSGPGAASFSNLNSGSSTASVSLEGIYVHMDSRMGFVHHLRQINVEFHVPPIPTASVTQPTCCAIWSISVTTQSGVEYSLDGTTYQASNTFSGLTRMIILYIRSEHQ
jgi:hypothetical protein